MATNTIPPVIDLEGEKLSFTGRSKTLLERIDDLKRIRDANPHDAAAEERYQQAMDQWNAHRRYIVDAFLYMLRITMQLEPVALSNILDSTYPNAQIRELTVNLAEMARAIAALEKRRGR